MGHPLTDPEEKAVRSVKEVEGGTQAQVGGLT